MDTFISKLFEWVWDLMERYLLPFCLVRHYEAGVILFLGRYQRKMKKGLNWKWPLLNESLTCLTKPETIELKNITVAIKGGHQISISLIGGYEVVDEVKFLLEANDSSSNIPHHFITVASDYITETDFEALIEKTTPYTKIKNKLNEEVKYMGVKFFMVGYGSICKTRPFSLINH